MPLFLVCKGIDLKNNSVKKKANKGQREAKVC